MPTMEALKAKGKIPKRANPSTIHDKLLVGYQGWFTCAGDGDPVHPDHHGWLHWFDAPIPQGGHPNTDLWPDTSEYSPSELYPAPGLQYKNGDQAFLFSSRSQKTVNRHFNWMAQHGVDGAFLQRFAHQLEDVNGMRRIRDEVGERVRAAAEEQGRVFAIMYDVSSVRDADIQRIIERDWVHLIREQGLLDSPAYLREKGKVVVGLWGFGLESTNHTPETLHSIASFLRRSTPGGAYIFGGTPAFWRRPDPPNPTSPPVNQPYHDLSPNFTPETFLQAYDAISPWSVGRYRDEDEADAFCGERVKGDLEVVVRWNRGEGESEGKKVDYVPVVLPGGSGFNLTSGGWKFNDIKRNGGRFLWRQIVNVLKEGKKQQDGGGVRILYAAMWDEYDEGTALMPVVEKKTQLPESDKFAFMALDEDGYDLPSDWYMRICGFAAELLRGERQVEEYFPSKDLLDYWSSRPRFEPQAVVTGPSKIEEDDDEFDTKGIVGPSEGQSYTEWVKIQEASEKDDVPPPAYTLEDDDTTQQVAEVPAQPLPVEPVQAQAITPTTRPTSHQQPQIPSQTQSPVARPSTAGSQATNTTRPLSINRHPQRPATAAPAVNSASRPNGYGTDALTNDFQRQTIAGSSGSHVAGPSNHPSAASSPPIPALHNRPTSSQSYTGSIGHHSRPSSSGQIPTVTSSESQTHPQNSGPWAQAQWPPAEWAVNRPAQQQLQQQASKYSFLDASPSLIQGSNTNINPNGSSSNLGRTSSAHVGVVAGSGPSAPIPGLGRASSVQASSTSSPYPVHADNASYALSRTSSHAAYPAHPVQLPPHQYHAQNTSSAYANYNSLDVSNSHPYSQTSGSYAPQTSPYVFADVSQQQRPQDTSSYLPSSSGNSYAASTSTDPHSFPSASNSPPVASSSTSSYTSSHNGNLYHGGSTMMPSFSQAPQAPDSSYFPQAEQYAHAPSSVYNNGYPSSSSTGYNPDYATTGPNWYPNSGPNSDGDYRYGYPPPTASNSSAMPTFPRPPVHASYSQPPPGMTGPSFPTAGGTMGGNSSPTRVPLGFVDKLVGKQTREQFEGTVGNLAQSGSKLLGKFISR